MRQDGVEGRALPVAGDENGNIVLVKARMSGRSAPLARLSRQVGPSALEGFEDEGLVRLDDPSQHPGLVGSGRAEKPMPPAEGRRWVNAAEFGGLRQALALDHRSGVIEPFLFLAQMRHGRLGQGVERAPAALAAEPQKSMRASPADDLAAPQCGQPRPSTRSWLAVPSASSRWPRLPRFFSEASAKSPDPEPVSARLAFVNACNASRRCPPLKPAIADSQAENSSALIESPPQSDSE